MILDRIAQETIEDINFDFKIRLSKDMKEAARLLGHKEASFLLDYYYQIQGLRMATANQALAAITSDEPNALIGWTRSQAERLEETIKASLGEFAKQYRVGQWLQQIHGIGPVLSAGLLTMFDIRRAHSAASFWRIAGMDPTAEWLGKKKAEAIVAEIMGDTKKSALVTDDHIIAASAKTTLKVETVRKLLAFSAKDVKPKREHLIKALSRPPYNRFLKMFCLGRVGESFIKAKGSKNDDYGKYYNEVKATITSRNEDGGYADDAAKYLANGSRWTGANMEAYSNGRLPKEHINKRARRWMVKLFISHLYEVMYEDFYGEKPRKPYVIDHVSGEHQYIEPPRWNPEKFSGKSLRELLVE